MTIRKAVTVACEWPYCSASLTTIHAQAAAARAEVAGAGWAYIDGLDLCGPPPADDVDRWYGLESMRPKNHAQLMQTGPHRPHLERNGKRYRPRCICGWTPEPTHLISWSDRVRAVRTWRIRHLYDLVKDEKESREEAGQSGISASQVDDG